MKERSRFPQDISGLRKLLLKAHPSDVGQWQVFVLLLGEFFAPREAEIREIAAQEGHTLQSARTSLNSERVELAGRLALPAFRAFAELLTEKLNDAVDELLCEVILKVSLENKVPLAIKNKSRLKVELQRLFERRKRERLGFRKRGGSKPKHALDALYSNYRNLHPLWRDAWKMYRQIRLRENWLEILSVAFTQLPPDLLKSLGSPDAQLRSPSRIAVQHAARLCGATDTDYTSEYLFRLVTKQRRLAFS